MGRLRVWSRFNIGAVEFESVEWSLSESEGVATCDRRDFEGFGVRPVSRSNFSLRFTVDGAATTVGEEDGAKVRDLVGDSCSPRPRPPSFLCFIWKEFCRIDPMC